MPNLGQTKTRLLATGALMVGGTLVGGALGGAAGGMLAASALGNIAASVAGGIFTNDLGDIVKGLGEDEEILNDRELTQAVGLAIALVIYSVARDKQYSHYKAALERVARKSVNDWQTIAAATEGDKDYVGVHEAQLIDIFSTNPAEFAKVRALDIPTWKHALGWLSNEAKVQLPDDVIEYVAQRLHTSFPKALREVLKHDASKGGQAFSEMQLLLLGKITAALKQSNTQDVDIVKRLESVATTQQVCQVMARVESGIRADLAEVKQSNERIEDLLQALSSSLRPPQRVPLQFQSLIAEKTEGFVGREFVFDAIAEFLQQQPNGYFIIEADPGVGKSAILAEYVRRNGCVAHFNVRSQGITRTDQFLQSICTQLIERYGLQYPIPIPSENTSDGNFLARLLNEINAVEAGLANNPATRNDRTATKLAHKLVIAVDALDEVDLKSQTEGANVLYLPASLPNGVYFIVTKRPTPLPLVVNKQQIFDLMQYQAESLEDVRTYIRQRISESPALQEWVSSRGLTEEEFVTTLGEKSDRNFMYLRYVLPEIESGAYQDLNKIENLPEGLEQYYYQHWGHMGMTAKPLPRDKIKIVYVLAEALQPVSCNLISELAGEDGLTVQEVLDDWEQFLREQRIDGQTRYSIYHASFQDFLHRKEIVRKAGETIEGVNARIVDSLTQGLFDDE